MRFCMNTLRKSPRRIIFCGDFSTKTFAFLTIYITIRSVFFTINPLLYEKERYFLSPCHGRSPVARRNNSGALRIVVDKRRYKEMNGQMIHVIDRQFHLRGMYQRKRYLQRRLSELCQKRLFQRRGRIQVFHMPKG